MDLSVRESPLFSRLRRVLAAPEHRPFWFIVANGILWQLSYSLFEPRRVIAAFLTDLTGRETMIGLALAIGPAAMFLPQLLTAYLVSDGRPRMPYYVWGARLRQVCYVIITVLTLTLYHQPFLLAWVFLVLYAMIGLGTGLGLVSFGDIVTRTVPAHRRGRLFALRIAGGSLAALPLGYVVTKILSPDFVLPAPRGYALLFFLSAALLIVGQEFFMRVEEPPLEPRERTAQTFAAFLREAFAKLRTDRSAIGVVAFLSLVPIAWTPVAFIVPYAMKTFGFSASVAGWFLAGGVAAAALSNIFWARWSDRVGNRLVMRLGTACILTAAALLSLLPLLADNNTAALAWLMLINAIGEMGFTGLTIGRINYIYELGPKDELPLYIGAINTCTAPATLLAPPLIGWLAHISYQTTFIVGCVAAVAAGAVTLLLREPRETQIGIGT